MPVFMRKMEAKGEKTISGGSNEGKKVNVFASRFQLFHISSRNSGEHNTAAMNRIDELLLSEVSQDVVDKQGASQVIWTGGASMEISKERLIELARFARTRDEIEAEREPNRTL